MPRLRTWSLIVLSASALALAGCSSSPSASSTSTTTNSNKAAGTSTAIASIPPADRSPAGTTGVAPTVVVPSGSPPTVLESANLITGNGPAAQDGDMLTVQYVLATYSSGKVVQSSWTGQPFGFTLGAGDVIPGWEKGMVGMRAGGRRELIIPPSLGYRDVAQGPGIAANDTLVFVVDVLKIN